jgi:hypothetical protein
MGVWVSSWWGQYAPSRALIVAADLGATVAASHLELAHRHLAAMGPSATEPPTPEGLDIIAEALAEAECELAAHDRTYWGWYDSEWGHFLIDPENIPWPTVEWTAEIYDHGPEDDDPDRGDKGPHLHAYGFIDPSNLWDPTMDPEHIRHQRNHLDLDDLDEVYTPTTAAALALHRVETVVGSIDHAEPRGDGSVILYGADTHQDYHGAVGYPLCRFFATRAGIVRSLTDDEQRALLEIYRGRLTNPTPTR